VTKSGVVKSDFSVVGVGPLKGLGLQKQPSATENAKGQGWEGVEVGGHLKALRETRPNLEKPV